MKTKSTFRNLIVSLINYQVLNAIILYLAKKQGENFYLKKEINAKSNE